MENRHFEDDPFPSHTRTAVSSVKKTFSPWVVISVRPFTNTTASRPAEGETYTECQTKVLLKHSCDGPAGIHGYSYQQRTLSQLAEVVMRNLEENQQPNSPPSSPQTDNVAPPPPPLPDIVTSSTPHAATTEPDRPRDQRRHRGKHARKTLQRFMRYNIAVLENESRYGPHT